jgi:hypothetical protein
MYRAGSLRVEGEDISKYELHLVGVQEVRWDGSGSGTDPVGQYKLFYGRGNDNNELGTVFFFFFFFFYTRESYQQLRG